ncbi:MAG TPA: hypothetical protein VFE62_29915, partial [Gemmataceae bacterium]|nr:hypothetical protein [Gemmataceae bacterium]
VRCFICRVPAFTACARCGKFYCSRHGRPQFNSLSTCLDCYDRRRPAFFISGCIFAAAAVAIGWIALMAPGPNDSKLPYYAIFLPMAATSLLGAVGFFWYSWRSYP